MAIKIPTDYNYKSIDLDPLEKKVRDQLKVNVENWAKFRHTITASVSSESLQSSSPISTEVKSSYLELSKSHYEVVTMMGATKLSMTNVKRSIKKDRLVFKKSFKEFYMHAGSVIDNLARLIYIINIPDAPTKIGKYGGYKRHQIGYGNLYGLCTHFSSHLQGYCKFIKSKKVNEIKTVRNNFTHSWPPTVFLDNNTGELFWPTAMRKREQYYLWPHDAEEAKKIKKQYRRRVPIIEMIESDWKVLEEFQNAVFKRLIKDVSKFEVNHGITIK
jgi:hypothetical protein